MMPCILVYGDDLMSVYDIAQRLKDSWQERVTGAPKFIDTDHAYIHEGGAFHVAFTATQTNSTDKYAFVTPADKYIHFRPNEITVEKGTVSFGMYESTELASTGWTSMSTEIYNRNRLSTNESQITMYSAATSNTGLLVDRMVVVGGSGPGRTGQGASDGAQLELVLKQNTQYRFEFNTTETFHAHLYWYEEDSA